MVSRVWDRQRSPLQGAGVEAPPQAIAEMYNSREQVEASQVKIK